jgi:uncharacterized protein (TIGR02118 family)
VPTAAVIWDPDPSFAFPSGVELRDALSDQGAYAAGTTFARFAVGELPAVPERAGRRVWAWRVTEDVPISGPSDCAVTMVSLIRRRVDLTPAAFADHWRARHAPLARRRHVGLADYRQYVVLETLTAATPEIDGIARLGFVTRDDFEHRFFDSDEGRAEVMADVARFMDRPGPETTLVGPPGPESVPG